MSPKDYTKYLHSIKCVVCDVTEGKKTFPVQSHHVEPIRDKYSDFAQVPLCVFHHSELHRLSRRGFARRYNLDELDLLKHTIRLLMENK